MGKLSKIYRELFLTEMGNLATAKDARTGGGYGRLGKPNGSGITYKSSDLYPYVEPPAELDPDVEEEDPLGSEETAQRFLAKIGVSGGSVDLYGKRRARVDRASFANSAAPGLGESIATMQGISPIPNLYKHKTASGGTGGVAWTVYKTGPGHKGGGFGSKKGFFGAPPPKSSDITPPVYNLRDLPDPGERALEKARRVHRELVDEFLDAKNEDEDDNSVENQDNF